MKWFLVFILSLISVVNADMQCPRSCDQGVCQRVCDKGGAIIAIHEHVLRPYINAEEYEKAVGEAIGELKIPGLLRAFHLKGFKGTRQGEYSIIWVFANQKVLEDNFGTPDKPKLPESWLHYENDVLAQYIIDEPDKIVFTDYKVKKEIAW